MPIYEYVCPQCGYAFEVMSRVMETTCPKCGAVCHPHPSRYNFKCPLN